MKNKNNLEDHFDDNDFDPKKATSELLSRTLFEDIISFCISAYAIPTGLRRLYESHNKLIQSVGDIHDIEVPNEALPENRPFFRNLMYTAPALLMSSFGMFMSGYYTNTLLENKWYGVAAWATANVSSGIYEIIRYYKDKSH